MEILKTVNARSIVSIKIEKLKKKRIKLLTNTDEIVLFFI